MKLFKNILILISYLLILTSCDTNEPPPQDNGNGNGEDKPKPKISLTVDDTSPTEVWLNLITENIPLPDTLKLIRNNDTVKTIEQFDSSYVIYEDSLIPSQSYSYRAVINDTVTSEATAVTMDTTSHDFSWEVFEFGEHGNSVLRDVAIIDENNIWAVGAVYLKDSTGGNDSKAYGIVHWDGQTWKPHKLFFDNGSILAPIRGIQIFNENDFYLSAGSIFHWDGSSSEAELVFSRLDLDDSDGTLEKIWGNSSSSIYAVGNKGSIAHYNGTSWRKIESGTDLTLSDVYGNNYNSIYISGTDISTVSGVLLNGNQSGFSIVKHSGIVDESQLFEQLYGELSAVWIDEKGTVYTGGNLLFWNRKGEWDYVRNLPENYLGGNPGTYYRGFISSIRGNASNDYILAGDRNTLRHYNGKTWKQLGMAYDPNSRYIWYEVEQKDDLIVAVGRNAGKAIIIKLKR